MNSQIDNQNLEEGESISTVLVKVWSPGLRHSNSSSPGGWHPATIPCGGRELEIGVYSDIYVECEMTSRPYLRACFRTDSNLT